MEENLLSAEAWVRRHGLADTAATPALATRLAARYRARLGSSVIIAVLFLVASAVQAYQLTTSGSPVAVAVLAVFTVGLVVAQFLLDRWVRRVDQQVGATLARRATHPVHPGWRAVVGWAHATLLLCAFLVAVAFAVAALTVDDSLVRYAALVLLTGVCGVGAVIAIQLRHLLANPVVADDEVSLTADVIMRIEDARDGNVPSVLWALPVVLLSGMAPGWWTAAAFAFTVAGVIGVVVVQVKSPNKGTMARRLVGVQ
jgi:hypothetical protein